MTGVEYMSTSPSMMIPFVVAVLAFIVQACFIIALAKEEGSKISSLVLEFFVISFISVLVFMASYVVAVGVFRPSVENHYIESIEETYGLTLNSDDLVDLGLLSEELSRTPVYVQDPQDSQKLLPLVARLEHDMIVLYSGQDSLSPLPVVKERN